MEAPILNPPIQHPDILWYHIAIMVIAGAAISTFFIDLRAKQWVKNGVFASKKVIFVADMFAYFQAAVFGALVGYYTLHWVLGLSFGLLGAFGNILFMPAIEPIVKAIGRKIAKLFNGNGNGKQSTPSSGESE